MLVIVPDNQLSLAIGKKGQNARLAAKLTGMRVDIKSESEVEDERRREEEERAQGRQACRPSPDVDAADRGRLIAAGLYSPARIARAGLAALADVPGLGERKAKSLLEAAQAWVAEHAAVVAARKRRSPGRTSAPRRRIAPGDGEVGRRRSGAQSSVNGGGVTTRRAAPDVYRMPADSAPRRRLIRLVRGADGRVRVDPDGRGGRARGVCCAPTRLPGEGAGRWTVGSCVPGAEPAAGRERGGDSGNLAEEVRALWRHE